MTRSHAGSARGDATTAPRREGLAGLRAWLVQQHAFRREQLERYALRAGMSAPSAAQDPTDEVQALIASGARRALQDIELALSRIADGGYGRCRVCHRKIPLAVLQAVPQTTMCLTCLHAPGSRR